jgi:hypothetical protein
MTTRLIILAAALFCWAAPAVGQAVKSLGYNTTNGRIVAATNVVWTNAFNFSTNTVAAQVRTNLGGTTVGNSVFTATNAAAAAMAIELGTNNKVSFDTVSAKQSTGFSSTTLNGIQWQNMYPSSNGLIGLYGSDAEGTTTFGINIGTMSGTTAEVALFNANRITFYEPLAFNNTTNAATTRTNLGLGEASEVLFDSVQFINHDSAATTNFAQLGIRSAANGFGGFYSAYDGAFKFAFAAGSSSNGLGDVILFRANSVELVKPFQFIGTNATLNAATSRTNLGLGGGLITNIVAGTNTLVFSNGILTGVNP